MKKDAQPALQRVPASLYQSAFDGLPDGVIIYDVEQNGRSRHATFRVVAVNQQAARMIGLPADEMVGQTTDQLFPNASGLELWHRALDTLKTRQPQQYDSFYRMSRTRYEAWFRISLVPMSEQCVLVQFSDVTELRQTAQSLLGDSIIFRALSSRVPDTGVVVVDFFQKITLATGLLPGLLRTQDAEELIGTPLSHAILPEFVDDWKRYVTTALDGQEHFFTDHWSGWRCECYVGPVRNDAGLVVMALIVFRNVSEQYKQQQALQQMNQALRQSNESLEQFAYVASHDLQEPLRKIRAFGDILRTNHGPALGPDGANLIDRMQAASDRMSNLIRSLLSYARLSARQQTRSLVSLEDLFSDLLSDLDVVIDEKKAVVRLTPPLPTLPGDAEQLRQVFQNLLTNAIKFSQPDQPPIVTVAARLVDGRNVPHIVADSDAQYAEVSVQDNGIGIEPQYFERIFGLFGRLHGRQQYAGTGIGLATVRKVIDNHYGTVTVESQPGEGTTFRVYLPMTDNVVGGE